MLYNELCSAVGKGNVGAGPAAREAYSSDASCIRGSAVAVVRPSSVSEVQEIVRIAGSRRIPVFPRGGGTGLCGGAVPLGGIVVDLSLMDRVSVKGNSCVCGPGVIVSALNRALHSNGLWFPVIPSSHRVCTVGGAISTNAAGSRSVRYGKAGDWVLGLGIVDGKGGFLRTKGPDAFCGTEGAVGIIVEARLRVAKLPSELSMDLFKFRDLRKAASNIPSILGGSGVSALEVTCRTTSSLLGLGRFYCLFVEYESREGKVSGAGEMNSLWELREGAYPALAARGFSRIEDPVVPRERLAEFLSWLDSRRIPFFGHAGAGIIHPCLPSSHSPSQIYKKASSIGGSVSGEHGFGLLKKGFAPREFVSRIKGLKSAHDPFNILNRGKLYA